MRNQRLASLRKPTVVSLAQMEKKPLQNETVLSRNNASAFSDSAEDHRPQEAVVTAEAREPTPTTNQS